MKRSLLFTFLLLLIAAVGFAQTDTGTVTYKLAVNFRSIGAGTSSNQPLKDYIAKFKKTYGIKSIKADHIGPLGKEGEYMLGFKLKELTKKQRTRFITGVKKVAATMNSRGRTNVTENEKVVKSELWDRASVKTEKF